jgi:hypothetical protein
MMIVQIGVEVIDEQCAKCPRLKVSSEELYGNGRVVHMSYFCGHIAFCRDVRNVLAAHEEERDET